MRKNFLIWLSALICAAFLVTGALAYYQFRKHAQDRASQILTTKLNDLMGLITHASASVEQVASINDASTLERTRAMAEFVRLRPACLRNQELLQGFCNDLGATQVCITNDKGVVVAAIPSSRVGQDLSQEEAMQPFMECISTPGTEVCNRPGVADPGQSGLQFAAVSRRDRSGIVCIGFRPHQEQMMRAAANIGRLVSSYQPGKNGHIIAFLGGEALNKDELPGSPMSELLGLPLNKAGEISINDEEYYTYAVESDGFRLVGLMPVAELRQQTLYSVHRLVVSNLVLFILMFLTVAYLLQRFVIKGIRVINDSLKRISEGELNLRVEVNSSPEFVQLSTGINTMADTLLGYAEQQHQRIREELELARSIQSTALPNKFPAYPHHPEFDLYATCAQAKVVGGDFYDFFKTDTDHLAFLVADVSGSGIPAALYMMRCMSVIRSAARGQKDPLSIVTETNQVLGADNKEDLHLKLFFGILNFRTGSFSYVNAGTPQALLQHAGGDYEELDSERGDMLGPSSKNSVFISRSVSLQPGDRIFLYTAGVVRALDSGKTPFGMDRLHEALRTEASSVNDVLFNVRAALRHFMGGGDPNRDITMLSLEFRGRLYAHAEISTAAGEPDDVAATLARPLEEVLAAPSCIVDIQTAVSAVLGAWPAETAVDICLRCNAQEAEVTICCQTPDCNPLPTLAPIPVDDARYEPAENGGTITLRKNLE